MTKLSDEIRSHMIADNKRFWAGDNISEYVNEEQKQILISEATEAFESVLDTLLIDRHNDPNSKGTAKRLAKMYFNEIMSGRYESIPEATSFPNIGKRSYHGMLVVIRTQVNVLSSSSTGCWCCIHRYYSWREGNWFIKVYTYSTMVFSSWYITRRAL